MNTLNTPPHNTTRHGNPPLPEPTPGARTPERVDFRLHLLTPPCLLRRLRPRALRFRFQVVQLSPQRRDNLYGSRAEPTAARIGQGGKRCVTHSLHRLLLDPCLD